MKSQFNNSKNELLQNNSVYFLIVIFLIGFIVGCKGEEAEVDVEAPGDGTCLTWKNAHISEETVMHYLDNTGDKLEPGHEICVFEEEFLDNNGVKTKFESALRNAGSNRGRAENKIDELCSDGNCLCIYNGLCEKAINDEDKQLISGILQEQKYTITGEYHPLDCSAESGQESIEQEIGVSTTETTLSCGDYIQFFKPSGDDFWNTWNPQGGSCCQDEGCPDYANLIIADTTKLEAGTVVPECKYCCIVPQGCGSHCSDVAQSERCVDISEEEPEEPEDDEESSVNDCGISQNDCNCVWSTACCAYKNCGTLGGICVQSGGCNCCPDESNEGQATVGLVSDLVEEVAQEIESEVSDESKRNDFDLNFLVNYNQEKFDDFEPTITIQELLSIPDDTRTILLNKIKYLSQDDINIIRDNIGNERNDHLIDEPYHFKVIFAKIQGYNAIFIIGSYGYCSFIDKDDILTYNCFTVKNILAEFEKELTDCVYKFTPRYADYRFDALWILVFSYYLDIDHKIQLSISVYIDKFFMDAFDIAENDANAFVDESGLFIYDKLTFSSFSPASNSIDDSFESTIDNLLNYCEDFVYECKNACVDNRFKNINGEDFLCEQNPTDTEKTGYTVISQIQTINNNWCCNPYAPPDDRWTEGKCNYGNILWYHPEYCISWETDDRGLTGRDFVKDSIIHISPDLDNDFLEFVLTYLSWEGHGWSHCERFTIRGTQYSRVVCTGDYGENSNSRDCGLGQINRAAWQECYNIQLPIESKNICNVPECSCDYMLNGQTIKELGLCGYDDISTTPFFYYCNLASIINYLKRTRSDIRICDMEYSQDPYDNYGLPGEGGDGDGNKDIIYKNYAAKFQDMNSANDRPRAEGLLEGQTPTEGGLYLCEQRNALYALPRVIQYYQNLGIIDTQAMCNQLVRDICFGSDTAKSYWTLRMKEELDLTRKENYKDCIDQLTVNGC
ncbi:hypothetical protein GF327_09630 [Candidatus Woesearchaeota archaeon]|nr:hypothetical protein [Candidatus Woesearchaeota archaeon]